MYNVGLFEPSGLLLPTHLVMLLFILFCPVGAGALSWFSREGGLVYPKALVRDATMGCWCDGERPLCKPGCIPVLLLLI